MNKNPFKLCITLFSMERSHNVSSFPRASGSQVNYSFSHFSENGTFLEIMWSTLMQTLPFQQRNRSAAAVKFSHGCHVNYASQIMEHHTSAHNISSSLMHHSQKHFALPVKHTMITSKLFTEGSSLVQVLSLCIDYWLGLETMTYTTPHICHYIYVFLMCSLSLL